MQVMCHVVTQLERKKEEAERVSTEVEGQCPPYLGGNRVSVYASPRGIYS